jgi:hypothetical protein
MKEYAMKLNANVLVGENMIDNAVLRNVILNALCDLGDGEAFLEGWVSDPDETGIMSAEATWTYGSLEFQAWIEVDSPLADPAPEIFENGEFDLTFKWRTPEQEGIWYQLQEICASDERALAARDEPWEGLRLFTA